MFVETFNSITFALVPGIAEGRRERYRSYDNLLTIVNSAIKERNILYSSIAITAIAATMESFYGSAISIPVRYPSAIMAFLAAGCFVATNISKDKNGSLLHSLLSIFKRAHEEKTDAREDSTTVDTNTVSISNESVVRNNAENTTAQSSTFIVKIIKSKQFEKNFENAILVVSVVAAIYGAIFVSHEMELYPYRYIAAIGTAVSLKAAKKLSTYTLEIYKVAKKVDCRLELFGSYGS